eukprot:ANDGO_05174.mRNA.1 Chitinase domain-containing protein 1
MTKFVVFALLCGCWVCGTVIAALPPVSCLRESRLPAASIQKKNPSWDWIVSHALDCTNSTSTLQSPSIAKAKIKAGRKVLTFTTPWNSRGYDIVRAFPQKIDIVSPVGLEIHVVQESPSLPSSSESPMFSVAGTDVMHVEEWKDWRRRNEHMMIAPRVVLDSLHPQIIEELVAIATDYAVDGFVLEWGYVGWDAYVDGLLGWLQLAKQKLGSSFALYLVVGAPKPPSTTFLSPANARKVLDAIDGILLMTYDYQMGTGAPIAPYKWLLEIYLYYGESLVKSGRFFFGLAFYGRDNGEAITGEQWLELLATYKPVAGKDLLWNDLDQETVLLYTDAAGVDHVVRYPSLASVQSRLKLFTSVLIWEAGQGLDSFWDLF